MTTLGTANMSGLRKAATLLVLLGEEVASDIYRHLPQSDVQRLTQEIAEMDYVSPDVAATVLQEYYRLSHTQEFDAQGGTDYAQRLLVKAFGEEGAKALLQQVVQAQELSASNLDSLQKADPHQLAKFVEGEHPQTIALVLSHLGPRMAALVLAQMPEKVRGLVAERLAKMRQFSPEMVQKIALVLHKKLQALGGQSRRAYGGVEAVADILNRMDFPQSKAILETIEQEDAQLAVAIRNLMFAFEDLISVPENGIREILAQIDKRTLAVALKGASESMKNYIFKCLSSRAADMLKEDMEIMGPVRAREVSHAQHEVVTLARRLETEGRLSLRSDGEDTYVV